MNKKFEKFFETDASVAYLIFWDTNRFYLTGFPSTAGTVILMRDKQYFLTDSRYSEAAAQKLEGIFEVIDARPAQVNEIAKEIFRRENVTAVYLENRTLFYEQYLELAENFKDFEIRKMDDRLELLRSIKTDEELVQIRAAQEIAEKAYEKVTSSLRAGMSERDVAVELDYQMIKFGAEKSSFETIVAFDENASKPHYVPSGEVKLKSNSIVLIDFGAKFGNYCSDTTRTFCWGKPSEEFSKVFNIVLRAVENFEKFVKAGVQCNEADAFCRELISANGYGPQFLHTTGHGVGLDIHEYPTLGQASKVVLEENMVVTCEPGIYLPGKFGVRTEDLLVIKSDGIEVLTKLSKDISR